MLALGAELRGHYAVSFVRPASRVGSPVLARAKGANLPSRGRSLVENEFGAKRAARETPGVYEELVR